MLRAKPSEVGAVGIDLVEIRKIGRLLSHGKARLSRFFSSCELKPLQAKNRTSSPRVSYNSMKRLACAFAGKEAVFKALGRGWGQGMRWNDVCLSRGHDGSWSVKLIGHAAERLKEIGGSHVAVSMTVSKGHAIAQAVVIML